MRRRVNESDLAKFPEFVNKKLNGVSVEIRDLDNGERNFTLKLTGNEAGFDAAKDTIKRFMDDLHGEYALVGNDKDALKYSADKKGNFKLSAGKEVNGVKEVEMKERVNKIADAILEGQDITQAILTTPVEEAAGRLVSVKIVNEPHGKGIEIKDSNGAVYKYVVDVNDPKYYTPEKVLHAVQGLARRYNNDMGKIYNFLKDHTVDYYDKDLTNRANLDKTEIVPERNGEGLKVTLDNGQVYRYTVDTKDEKYNTLQSLKDAVDGMWRHGASIDGLITFLDKHAMLYAREDAEVAETLYVISDGEGWSRQFNKGKNNA